MSGILETVLAEVRDVRTDVRYLRKSNDDGMARLDAKIDGVIKANHAHELRISKMEQSWAAVKWAKRTAVVAALTFVGDLLTNHVPRWWRALFP